MSTRTPLVTAEELFWMPKKGFRYELVAGELRKMNPAGGEHGMIAMRPAIELGIYVKQHDLGTVFAAETGFRLLADPDTVRAPDVAFISNERLPPAQVLKKFIPLAPDLAVEVLSPDDSAKEVREKVEDWLRAGTRLVWVVSPKRSNVTAYRSTSDTQVFNEGDLLEGGDVVPGFQCAVSELFA